MNPSIQHRGIVERVEADVVVLRVEKQSACSSCFAQGVCGEKGVERVIEVTTPYAANYTAGERVIVALLKNSMGYSSILWGYLIPLVVLLAVLFGAHLAGVGDGPAALSSLVAIAIYYAVLYVKRNYFKKKIQFTIIKE